MVPISQMAETTLRFVEANSPLHPNPTEQTQSSIGRFEIRSVLGAGAFGKVYRAYDTVLEREVALKVPHPGLLETEDDKARYLREPKAAAQLHHANIVPVFDASLDGNDLFIASAFIEGQTLQQRLRDGHPDFQQTADWLIQLADALHYAHSNHIVHRDVKPANIMIDTNGAPQIMDFGLARIEADAEQLTVEGTVMGTPAYMAPEQAAGKTDQVGSASDQYSLGAVMYKLLCGQLPFSGPPAMVISLVINQEPVPPSKINRRISKDLETICLKAMAKEPRKRYRDCRALAEDLRSWLRGEPISARPIAPIERFGRWCRRNPAIAVLGATSALLLVGGTVVSSYFALQAHSRTLAETAARKEVEASREEIVEQRDRALGASYAHQLQMAQSAWREQEPLRLRAVLEETEPVSGAPDFRGWEWDYLNNINRAPTKSFEVEGQPSWWIDWSPDGKTIATSSYLIRNLGRNKGPIDLWDYENGTKLRRIADLGYSVKWSPDGRYLLASEDQKTLSIWNAETGERLVRTMPVSNILIEFKWFSNGRHFAATWGNQRVGQEFATSGGVGVWDAATGKRLAASEIVNTGPYGLVPSIDGKNVFVICADPTRKEVIKIFDWQANQLSEKPFKGTHGPMEISYDGRYAICDDPSSTDGIHVLNTENWEVTAHLKPGGFNCRFVSDSTDVVASHHGLLLTYKRSFQRRGILHWGVGDGSASCSPGGTAIATPMGKPTSANGNISIWPNSYENEISTEIVITDNFQRYTQSAERGLGFSVWAGSANHLVVTDDEGRLGLIDLATGRKNWFGSLGSNACIGLFASSDGYKLFVATARGEVEEWDTISLKLTRTHGIAASGALAAYKKMVSFAWNGKIEDTALATFSTGERILWNLQTSKSIQSPPVRSGVTASIGAPSGNLFISGTEGGVLIVESLPDFSVIGKWHLSDTAVSNVEVSPQAEKIAVAFRDDSRIAIVSAHRGDEPPVWLSTDSPVNAITWHPSQSRLASSHQAGVFIWNTDTGEVLLEMTGKGYRQDDRFVDQFLSLGWSVDGMKLAGAGVIYYQFAKRMSGIYVWNALPRDAPRLTRNCPP